MNTFGSLAVAGMLVMGGAGVAGAAENTQPVVTISSFNAYNGTDATLSDGSNGKHIFVGGTINNIESLDPHTHFGTFTDPTSITVTEGTYNWDIYAGSLAVADGSTEGFEETSATSGSTKLVINGGTFEGAELAGGGSASTTGTGVASVTVQGDTSVTINSYTHTGGGLDYIMAGNKVLAGGGAATGKITGNTNLIIDPAGGKNVTTTAVVLGGSGVRVFNGTDTKASDTINGNTNVTINGGTLAGVVGGSLAEVLSGTGTGTVTVNGNTNVTVNEGIINQIKFGSNTTPGITADPSVVGGSMAYGDGAVALNKGNTLVTINGGTINDKVLGGSLAQKGGAVTLGTEDAHVTSGIVVKNVSKVGDLVGGNMAQGGMAILHGDSFVEVKAGQVEGDIMGGSYARGAGTVTTNGNTSVVFSAANSSMVPQAEYIVGGDKVLGNDTATGEITGTSSVTINNGASVTTGAVVGGSFSRATPGTATATVANSVVTINGGTSIAGVVGGGLAEHLTGTGSAKSVVEGTSSVVINGGTVTNIVYTTSSGTKASSSAAVAGAGFATGNNATASVGNSVVVIDGDKTVIQGNKGTIEGVDFDDKDNAKVVAGGVAVNGGTVKVTNTSLTMKNGTVTGDLIGGGFVDSSAGTANVDGSTHITVSGGSLVDAEIIGGGSVRNANGTANVTGDTHVTVTKYANELNDQKWVQYVLGGGKAMTNGTQTATANVAGNTNVIIGEQGAIGEALDIQYGTVAGGGLARAQKAGDTATANVDNNANVTVHSGILSGVAGGGIAENYGTGTADATVTGAANLTINGGTINGVKYKDVDTDKVKVAVLGGGIAKGTGANATTTAANTIINGGTIKGHVVAGGLADGGTATVGTANLTIKGGEINGSVYAGGAALGGGEATVEKFDVRITGGTIDGDVVAGNYTGEPATEASLMALSAPRSSDSSGSISFSGGTVTGNVVVQDDVIANVIIDGTGATVTGSYQGNAKSTLTFQNYNTDFNKVATGFGTLEAAAGSNVTLTKLSTGAQTGDETGFFGGGSVPEITVTGEGTVTATNVNVDGSKTLTVADGGTLVAKSLTTDTNSTAKTKGLGSTLIIGNSNLTSIAGSSLSSTAGSEIRFDNLDDDIALSTIQNTLATSNTGIVNVGDTKVTGLSDLVVDGKVSYKGWNGAASGFTTDAMKQATLTKIDSAFTGTGSFGSAELSKNTQLNVGIGESSGPTPGNLTLTGLDGNAFFAMKANGEVADASVAKDSSLTLGDNAYAASKSIGKVTLGKDATLGVLGAGWDVATVNSGAITTAATGTKVNAKNVTLNVAGHIGGDGTATNKSIDTLTADAANVIANGDVYANTVTLTNGLLQAMATTGDTPAGGDITLGTLSGQGAVVADKTLKLQKAYIGTEGDDLTLQAETLKTAAIDSTTGDLAIAVTNLVTGGDTTLVDDTLVADNVQLGGALTASGASLVQVQDFGKYETSSGTFTPGALDQAVSVQDTSLMAYGADLAQAQQAVAETGHTGAAYYAGKTLTLTTGGSLTVGDASAPTANAITVAFGSDSLLVVDGTAMNGKTVFTGEEASPNLTASVDAGSKLHVDNAIAGNFTVFDENFTKPTDGWAADNVTTDSAMLDASYNDTDSKVTVKTNNAHTVFPNLSDGMADAVNDLYNGKLNNVDSTDMGVRFLSRATNDHFLGADKDAAAATIESAARIAFAGAVPQMTKMASDAATNAVVNRLGFANPADGAQAMDAEGKIVDRNTTGFALWIAPLWQSQHGWGMDADSMDYGFNGNLGGVSLGADYTFENAIRAGITFNIGGGYAESSGGDLNSTENRMSFWGLGAYAGWNYENFGLMADVSYTSTWNDLKQDMDSRMGMGDLEADVQASAISAGLRAEYKLETSVLDVIPHIGVRYMSLNTWGFDAESNGGTVLEGDGFHQDIWTFPVGVTFTKDFTLDSGWSFKPSIDFSVIPAAGDIKAKQDVAFTGLPGSYEVETQMMDYLTWQGGVGLEMGNDTMSFGVNYTLQAGQHTTGHGVFGSFRYEF